MRLTSFLRQNSIPRQNSTVIKKLHFGTMFHFWTFHFTSKFYCRFKFHQYHSSTLDQNQFIQINHHVTFKAPASFTSWQITVKIHCTVLSQSVANNTDAPQWSLIGCEENPVSPTQTFVSLARWCLYVKHTFVTVTLFLYQCF